MKIVIIFGHQPYQTGNGNVELWAEIAASSNGFLRPSPPGTKKLSFYTTLGLVVVSKKRFSGAIHADHNFDYQGLMKESIDQIEFIKTINIIINISKISKNGGGISNYFRIFSNYFQVFSNYFQLISRRIMKTGKELIVMSINIFAGIVNLQLTLTLSSAVCNIRLNYIIP